ncbi:hypothetical protein ACIA8O_15360 [Kitasatospora sp. NPDC051853]|uniref:hypothetical protein n=1 Tax=Kitasatospora sp. NPDC051853 TaxID=3364058 RepID=UPI0037ABF8D7
MTDTPHVCAYQQVPAGGPLSARWCVEHFAPVLRALPEGLDERSVSRPELLLHQETIGGRNWEIYYVPFDRIDPAARVALVGITPGRRQLHLAVQAARAALLAGVAPDEAVRLAKQTGAFGGTIRTHAVTMLDRIGLADALGLATTARLWDPQERVAAFTSAVGHAVFVDGKNWNGARLTGIPVLRTFAEQVLGAELAAMPQALVIPFGKAATEAVQLAVDSGRLPAERCLLGFPHPSGANGHRQRQFDQEREQLTEAVAAWAAATSDR